MIKKEEIPESPLFGGIDPEEKESILKCLSAVEKTYEKGDVIFHAGSRISTMGFVVKGSVEIGRDDFWGNRQVLGIAGEGELFGEAYACMQEETLMVTVTAAAKCRILFLDLAKILHVCSPACTHHSRLIRNLLSIMARKNLALTRKIDHMGQRSMREKVMAYLSFEAEKQKKKDFLIPYKRQELADYLAVDRSALSAELSRMKKDGLIDYEKSHFKIM